MVEVDLPTPATGEASPTGDRPQGLPQRVNQVKVSMGSTFTVSDQAVLCDRGLALNLNPVQRPRGDQEPVNAIFFMDLAATIREIPDFPKPGILFRDINPLLRNPAAMSDVIKRLERVCEEVRPDLIVGIESRGFLVGAPLALHCALGFVPVRKPGKLPGDVIGIDYALEYGSDRLELQQEALTGSPRVLVVDDLLATGGTAAATGSLVLSAGAELVGFAFVIELESLGGRESLPAGVPVESLIRYP